MINRYIVAVVSPNKKLFRQFSKLANSPQKAQLSTSASCTTNVLNYDTMNQTIKEVSYAVRGPIVARALEIENDLKKGSTEYNFKEVVKCNIGDCHATGQEPMTMIRQVVAGMALPSLADQFPEDIKDRISYLRDGCGGRSVGAYSNSAGLSVIKQHVADYINSRDATDTCSADDIFLTDGASGGIVQVLKMLPKGTGVMVPTPQYPLYSATISELSLTRVNYYLNEETNWSLEQPELVRSYNEAKKAGFPPKVVCIINPGNPTGNVLSKSNIEGIIKFAYEHEMLVLSDEVYQDNIYGKDCKFHSFRSVVESLGEPYKSGLMFSSFHSTSKGYMGECGFRSGYMELNNWCSDVRAELGKLQSTRLCPPVAGQVVMDCVVNKPKPGDPSYNLWKAEKDAVLDGLKEKAILTADGFNKVDGISCQPIQGAMYSFPSVTMPVKFLADCKSKGVEPDAVYCLEFLNTYGVCVVPGSGFGQRPGTFHFRMTILPPAEKMRYVMEAIGKFHNEFTEKWA